MLPACVPLQSCCRLVPGGSWSRWSSGTGRTRCGPPRPKVRPGSADLKSPGDPESLAAGTAGPGGLGGARGEFGQKLKSCSKEWGAQASVHHYLQFETCGGCDPNACPRSGVGSGCSRCGREAGCPCVSDVHRDRRLRKNRRRKSYPTPSNRWGARARGPWRLRGTSQEELAGRTGTCRSCCSSQQVL